VSFFFGIKETYAEVSFCLWHRHRREKEVVNRAVPIIFITEKISFPIIPPPAIALSHIPPSSESQSTHAGDGLCSQGHQLCFQARDIHLISFYSFFLH